MRRALCIEQTINSECNVRVTVKNKVMLLQLAADSLLSSVMLAAVPRVMVAY